MAGNSVPKAVPSSLQAKQGAEAAGETIEDLVEDVVEIFEKLDFLSGPMFHSKGRWIITKIPTWC